MSVIQQVLPTQKQFQGIVSDGLYKGEVNILSGAHGLEDGAMVAERGFYEADAAYFNLPGVTVHDVSTIRH